MSSENRNGRTHARRVVEASAWRAHLAESDLDSTPDFESWLRADEENRKAWDSVQQSWDLFGQHATSPELLDLRRAALDKTRAMGRERWSASSAMHRARRASAIAAALLMVVGGVITFSVLGPDVYKTGAGERRVVTLSDGSQVQLDSLTELRVKYSKTARELKLVRGQARFDVAHDLQRPFSVAAGARRVIATGTAFNIDLLGKELFVTLLEGKVVILPQAETEQAAAKTVAPAVQTTHSAPKALPTLAKVPVNGIELKAGEQLAVSANGATKVASANVQRTTAWQSGQLVFEDEPLSSVVARVNRYSVRQINLTDERTASLRISGVFRAGDVSGFVATVARYLPLDVQQDNDEIYLNERPGQAAGPAQ